MTETTKRLILASGSSYKRELLGRLGFEFESIPSFVSEEPGQGESPVATAQRLAAAKVVDVRESHPDAWVIGADQVIHLSDRIFHKPGTPDKAVEQLLELSGQTHTLLTAVAVATPEGSIESDLVRFEMEMRALTRAEATAYVDEDQPVDCAGSYKIESAGIKLFRRLNGDDYTAVIGLPLTRVWRLLELTDFIDHGQT